jgi:predicted ATP-grasp superfamily ATP-dependent carboligase
MKQKFLHDNVAVVLGMFETGLAVGRSLGRVGVRVLGLDSAKKVGFHSKYIDAEICPHPVEHEREFVAFLVDLAKRQEQKPVLFVTSDEFLVTISKNRECLGSHYLLNFPQADIIEALTDKWKQHELVAKAGVAAPRTFIVRDLQQLRSIKEDLPFPVFVKGREVNSWRKIMGVEQKGFLVNTPDEVVAIYRQLFQRGAAALIQEVIPGPDTNHFKACCYIGKDGEVLLAFALQKIRQQPVHFGFGCLVESIHYPELLELGKQFLTKIGYRGVGSVEFKLDARTSELKLIELNPRYWQQNGLAESCGMNFPLMNLLDVTDHRPKAVVDYRTQLKWVNIYNDFESFREYQRLGELSPYQWLKSLRGAKVYSDYARDDVHPCFYELTSRKILSRSLRVAGRALKDPFKSVVREDRTNSALASSRSSPKPAAF